jgi:hypothetical protein
MPRVSLTKRQLETEAGSELLGICQEIIDDGALSDAEIARLRDWLRVNEGADLPARDHLFALVEQVLRDGKISDEERRELYKAIETILPADLRPLAKLKRTDREASEKEEQKTAREADRERAREEKQRNRPIDGFNFMVAGVRHEGRQSVIDRFVDVGDPVHLRRDRKNRHSRHAVEVRTRQGYHIGFVPEGEARELAPLLDKSCLYQANIVKILGRTGAPIPVVDVDVYSQDATLPDLLLEGSAPVADAPVFWAPSSRPGTRKGERQLAAWLIVAVILLFFWVSC